MKKWLLPSLDGLGVDYIEGGWPGANPVDSELFERNRQNESNFYGLWNDKREPADQRQMTKSFPLYLIQDICCLLSG